MNEDINELYKRLDALAAEICELDVFKDEIINMKQERYDEKLKKVHEQLELEVLIYKNLEEFEKTRAIATAVEICDMFIKEMELDKE